MDYKSILNRPMMVTLAGSHAYGMNTEGSDIDLKGIVIVNPKDLYKIFNRPFEQYESTDWLFDNTWDKSKRIEKNILKRTNVSLSKDNTESILFELRKALALIANSNPNMMELLFCDDNDVLWTDDELSLLRENKNLFISLKLRFTYAGYAQSQLSRIKRHRSFIVDGIPHDPTREEYGLPANQPILPEGDKILVEKAVDDLMKEWYIEDLNIEDSVKRTLMVCMRDFMATTLQCSDKELDLEIKDLAARKLGLNDEVRFLLRQENKYKAAKENYQAYLRWEADRNPKRKELESKYRFDTKHASHLIRLTRTAVEFLETGKLIVKRPDAEELKAIRKGARTFEDICEESERLFQRIDELYKLNPCKIPHKVNFDKIEKLYYQIIGV